MEPPREFEHAVNPTIMQHEYLEMCPPLSTIDQHQDLPRHLEPLPRHHDHLTPDELRHRQEMKRGDIPLTEAKIEMWKTRGRPKHPIWKYFTHVHMQQEKKRGPPHLKTTMRDRVDVVCALCGAHISGEHKLYKGEVEPLEEIRLARSVLHGQWVHLAKDCPSCPDNLRHEMKTWQLLPKETLAEPPARAMPGSVPQDEGPVYVP